MRHLLFLAIIALPTTSFADCPQGFNAKLMTTTRATTVEKLLVEAAQKSPNATYSGALKAVNQAYPH